MKINKYGIEALRLNYLAGELSAADIACQLRCAEEDVLERIGIVELQRTLAYSPEEIEAMYRRNENFDGKQVAFDKLQLFHELKADLAEFLQHCDDVQRLEEIRPNPREKNAILFLDVGIVTTFDKEEISILTTIMERADRTVVSAIGNDCIRFSFCIENIWTE